MSVRSRGGAVDAEGRDEVLVQLEPDPVARIDLAPIDPGGLPRLRTLQGSGVSGVVPVEAFEDGGQAGRDRCQGVPDPGQLLQDPCVPRRLGMVVDREGVELDGSAGTIDRTAGGTLR